MKTYDVYRLIAEEGKKRFKRKSDSKIYEWNPHFSRFRLINPDCIELIIPDLSEEWEEVKEPVSFVEVLEQVSKSETEVLITIKHSQLNTIYSKVPFGWIVNRLFRDFKNDKQIAKILQTSEFYIE